MLNSNAAQNPGQYTATGRTDAWTRLQNIRLERSVLLVLLLIIGAIWSFVFIADVMLAGKTQAFDEAILLAMRAPHDLTNPIGPGWVEEMGRDFTALGGTAVLSLLTLAVVGYLLLIGKPRVAVVLLLATIGALITSSALKYGIDRPRPDLVPHGSIVYTKSFPSGHSMQAAATYLTLAALLARVQRRRRVGAYIIGIAAVATLLVGLSRIYLGVHWPTDVLAGWTAGTVWVLLSWLLVRSLQRRGKVETEDTDTEESSPQAAGRDSTQMRHNPDVDRSQTAPRH